jgi:uncharacterized protein YndB with AHSA1/START domain
MEVKWNVVVQRPQADVFAYLADIAKHGEWSPKPWRVAGHEGPLALGTKFESWGVIPGDKDHHNDVECTVFQPPTKLALTTVEQKEGKFVTSYVLTPDGSGTRVEKTMDMPKPTGAMGFFFPVLLAAYIKPAVQKGMNHLKQRLESQAAAA